MNLLSQKTDFNWQTYSRLISTTDLICHKFDLAAGKSTL